MPGATVYIFKLKDMDRQTDRLTDTRRQTYVRASSQLYLWLSDCKKKLRQQLIRTKGDGLAQNRTK